MAPLLFCMATGATFFGYGSMTAAPWTADRNKSDSQITARTSPPPPDGSVSQSAPKVLDPNWLWPARTLFRYWSRRSKSPARCDSVADVDDRHRFGWFAGVSDFISFLFFFVGASFFPPFFSSYFFILSIRRVIYFHCWYPSPPPPPLGYSSA